MNILHFNKSRLKSQPRKYLVAIKTNIKIDVMRFKTYEASQDFVKQCKQLNIEIVYIKSEPIDIASIH